MQWKSFIITLPTFFVSLSIVMRPIIQLDRYVVFWVGMLCWRLHGYWYLYKRSYQLPCVNYTVALLKRTSTRDIWTNAAFMQITNLSFSKCRYLLLDRTEFQGSIGATQNNQLLHRSMSHNGNLISNSIFPMQTRLYFSCWWILTNRRLVIPTWYQIG